MSGLDALTVVLAFAAGIAAGIVAWGVWLRLARRDRDPGPGEAPAGALMSPPAPARPVEAPLAPAPGRDSSAPTSAARTPARPSGELRISQRVVVHLSQQPRLSYGELAPFEVSQGGMTKALHVAQPAVAKVLRRLIDGGAVLELKMHVKGQPQRLKVYQLTAQGEAIARDLRRRIAEQRARTPTPGGWSFDPSDLGSTPRPTRAAAEAVGDGEPPVPSEP